MKTIHAIAKISLLLFVASSAYANQHLCPSPQGILQTINNKNMIQDNFDQGAVINFTNSFGTSENWVLFYSSEYSRSIDQLWKSFRNGFASLPNTPKYAVDKGEFWQCEYDLDRYSPDEMDSQTGIMTLKDPSPSHLCPSASAIKEHVDAKNMQFLYHNSSPLSPGYYYGVINFFDSFGTNEHWQLRFDVLHINNLNEGKNLYQKYSGDLNNETLYAKDEGFTWRCYYNTDPEDHNSPYNDGWTIYDRHHTRLYLTLKSK